MAHLVSIAFFLGVLVMLAWLLDRIFRESRAAIVAAWLQTPSAAKAELAATLSRWGTCLRASFVIKSQDSFGSDMNRLLRRIS